MEETKSLNSFRSTKRPVYGFGEARFTYGVNTTHLMDNGSLRNPPFAFKHNAHYCISMLKKKPIMIMRK